MQHITHGGVLFSVPQLVTHSPAMEEGWSLASLLRVRMSLTSRVMLAKVPGRTSSIRLLVRFTESSLGCVMNESG